MAGGSMGCGVAEPSYGQLLAPGTGTWGRFLAEVSPSAIPVCSYCSQPLLTFFFFIIIILIFHALPSEIQGREYNGFTAKAKTPPRAT